MNDTRTRIVYDDARHYVYTAPEKFDIITTDPIHPWVKGTSTLYSKEYFELVKRRLNPGGVVAQWLPIYDSDEETVKIQLATFFSVFPNGTVWSNFLNGDGYDLVLLGRPDAGPINVDALERRLASPYAGVAASLKSGSTLGRICWQPTQEEPRTWSRCLQACKLRISVCIAVPPGLGVNSLVSRRPIATFYRKFQDDLLAGSESG